MKLRISVITALVALAFTGHAEAARSLFTPLQERKMLEAVQEACNNTWCEGDFGYDFKKFHCEKASCQLDFEILVYTQYNKKGAPDLSSAQHHAESCTFAPVRRLSDVYNRRKNYVSSKYFLSLAKCIDEKASAISTENSPERGNPQDPVPPGSLAAPVPNPEDAKPEMPLPVEVNQVPANPSPFDINVTIPSFGP